MEDRRFSCRGGILGLVELIEQHGEAIEHELIRLGLRLRQLGTDVLTWRDLHVIVRQASRDSAIVREMYPDIFTWGQSEHLLAGAADSLRLLVWLQTEDARRKRNQPKPIPRPGVTPAEKSFGQGALPIDEMDAWLAARAN